MILHLYPKLFDNYVALASQKEAIDEAIVVKDYFIVLALKYVYSLRHDVVLIGGTSLSKCFHLIQRFSEDIDLVATAKSRKAKQKATHNLLHELVSMWPWRTESLHEKYADFKELYLHYGAQHNTTLDQRIKIELLTFMDPFPVIPKRIEAMVSKYLDPDEIESYKMQPVSIFTQEPYRTFLEKITLEKEIFKQEQKGYLLEETQEKRARDFYDIHKIWLYYGRQIPIHRNLIHLILASRQNHRKNRTSLSIDEFNDYPLFDMFQKKNLRKQLETVDFKKLSIRDLDSDDIEISLKEIDAAFESLRILEPKP